MHQSIWKHKDDPSHMIIRQGTDSLSELFGQKWDKVSDFYTFRAKVDHEIESYSVSTYNYGSGGRLQRVVQKGKDIVTNNQKHMYNFGALPKWQPELRVHFFAIKSI